MKTSTAGGCKDAASVLERALCMPDCRVYSRFQCLLHMPQLLPELRAPAVLFAIDNIDLFWGMCSKHCTIADAQQ